MTSESDHLAVRLTPAQHSACLNAHARYDTIRDHATTTTTQTGHELQGTRLQLYRSRIALTLTRDDHARSGAPTRTLAGAATRISRVIGEAWVPSSAALYPRDSMVDAGLRYDRDATPDA